MDFQTDPIVAWRAWKVQDGQLRSLVFSYEWPALQPMEASCRRGVCTPLQSPHPIGKPAPQGGCLCGLYAVKTLDHAMKIRGGSNAFAGGNATIVVGHVSLWGHVIETERGYRAQYAYPLDFMLPGGRCRALCRAYAVDELPQPEDALKS